MLVGLCPHCELDVAGRMHTDPATCISLMCPWSQSRQWVAGWAPSSAFSVFDEPVYLQGIMHATHGRVVCNDGVIRIYHWGRAVCIN